MIEIVNVIFMEIMHPNAMYDSINEDKTIMDILEMIIIIILDIVMEIIMIIIEIIIIIEVVMVIIGVIMQIIRVIIVIIMETIMNIIREIETMPLIVIHHTISAHQMSVI